MARDEPCCPECAEGKHRNCTGWAIDQTDTIVDCACPECY